MATPPSALAPRRPFGAVLTAMVTPFAQDGSVDLDAAAGLAVHLVDQGHDGLVVNGTTGESPTTTDVEKAALVRAVVEAVGDRAHVLAGVGTNDTAHSCELARQAERSGAGGLLVVTPYYSKPSQAGLALHFTTVAGACDLPVMLYDIPGRSAVPIHTPTLVEVSAHPNIVAVKDAKDDLFAASEVAVATDLAWYSGTDELNLAHLTHGAAGMVSVVGHLAGPQLAALVRAVDGADLGTALEVHRSMLPLTRAVMKVTQGVVMVKAGLEVRGLLARRSVRLPLVQATSDEVELLRAALDGAPLNA